MRASPSVVMLVLAVVVTAIGVGSMRWLGARSQATLGFWFRTDAFELPPAVQRDLGGPLTPEEISVIRSIADDEVRRAFRDLGVAVTAQPTAFWRVEVRPFLPGRGPLPRAGEAYGFGPLGGAGAVSFGVLANSALEFAPEGASREAIVAAIGRGIGRAAAHEFAHQILGPGAAHNPRDETSYEFPHSARASQYYGELHWTTALPALQERLGVVTH